MALIKCKECGKDISDTAKVCINCGAKTEKTKTTNKNIKIISIVSLAIILIISSIILININKPINKYKKEIKAIVNEYLDYNITANQAYKQLDAIQIELDEEYNNNKDTSYLPLRAKANLIKVYLSSDDYLKIKEELKDL